MTNFPSVPLPTTTPTFMIRIKDDKVSELYANFCEPKWRDLGFNVQMFDAVTPSTLPSHTGLEFGYVTSAKYTSRNLKKTFTLTEQSVWYSHYSLWEKCIQLACPILIIEQDTIPSNPNNLVLPLYKDNPYDIIFYDKFTMGCYYLNPKVAEFLMRACSSKKIELGPYGTIENHIQRAFKNTNDITIVSHALGPFTKSWDSWYAAEQVMDIAYGTSIDHYTNTEAEPFKEKFESKFKEIFKQVSLS